MSENTANTEWSTARGEKWRAQLTAMEATIAPVNEPLILALGFDAPVRIAEVGCGGGGTALEILQRSPAGSVVHGYDISPVLIEAARARILPGQRDIAFEVADMGVALPPDKLYDRLTSRFGIMFFDDPAAAFSNLAGWLAPGGRFAFAVWGDLAGNPWMTAVRDAVGGVIKLPKPDPEGPGPFRYASVDKLLALLGGAGFSGLNVRDWRGKIAVGGGLPAVEAANFAVAAFSSFGELLTEAGDEALNTARQALTARFSQQEEGGVVRMDAAVHIVSGTRRG